jgi:hypothetical protein
MSNTHIMEENSRDEENKMSTIDKLRAEAERTRPEREAFELAMFDHLDANPKGCGDMDCNYCATWADHLRDEHEAYEMSQAFDSSPAVVTTDLF